MEDNLNGKHLNGRQPQWKTTSMKDDLNGRQWKLVVLYDRRYLEEEEKHQTS